VIEKVDHKNLNLDVDFMSGKMASTENLAIELWNILTPKISTISKFGKLHSIRLFETPRNYVEYFGG
jgi:6-pyruvoyltetrahydropterin/6-carboxytetrahydropterin synthase